MARANTLRLIPAMMLVAFSGTASASGFQLLEQNASGLGAAFAGSAAVAEDASTVFFNPAGMALLPKGKNVAFGLDAINTSMKFSNTASVAPTLQTLHNDNGGDAGGPAFVPHGYFTMPINDQMSFGLGVSAPFGLKTEYDSGWDGRFQAIKSDVKIINLNPSLSFKVSDTVALGFGLNYQHLKGEFTQAVNYAGTIFRATNSAALAGAAGEGTAKITGSDNAWGYNFGAMFQLSPATRMGISYRSAIEYHLTGSAEFSPTANATVNGALATPTSPARGGAITADIKIPDVLIISGLHHLDDKWDIMGDLSWTGWSKIPVLTFNYANGPASLSSTKEDWRDTWRAAIGASYKYSAQWKARMGLAFDQSPVPDDTRTPRLPDSDRTWLSLGGQYKPSRNSAIDFGYTHIFVKNGTINNNGGSATAQAAYGLVQGTYKNSVDILGAQYSFSF
ncbi:MAG: outer membrane protein transport protein [Sterolibacterium sp.]|nr:outer membrane protein transport protein [Sterolibacterium sp.]